MKDALGHGSDGNGGSTIGQAIQNRAASFGSKFQSIASPGGVRDADAAQTLDHSGQGAPPPHPAMGSGNRGEAGPINSGNIEHFAAIARRAQANHDLGKKLTKMGFFGKA